MFEHARQAIGRRTEHPLFVSLFVAAVLFTGLGFYAEATGSPVHAAFLIIFAMLFTALGLLGYSVSFAAKVFAQYRERSRPF